MSVSAPEDRYNFFDLAALFIRRKRLIIWPTAAVMLVCLVVMLVLPNKYKSAASILPSGNRDRSFELKEMAGLGALSSQDENSSELYPVILASRQVRMAILQRDYTFKHKSLDRQISLADYFRTENGDRLLAALAAVTKIHADKKNGVITLTVETNHPGLSQGIAQAYLDELEHFNIYKRKTKAGETVRYLEKHLAQLGSELQAAEDSLQDYQNVNRAWAGTTSPEVLKMLGRLQREVESKSQTYLGLQRELEMARLDAQKDIPIVRVLDAPSLPTLKSWPRRGMTVLLAGLVTFMLSLAAIILHEYLRTDHNPARRESLDGLRDEFTRQFPTFKRTMDRLKIRQKITV